MFNSNYNPHRKDLDSQIKYVYDECAFPPSSHRQGKQEAIQVRPHCRLVCFILIIVNAVKHNQC